MNVYTHSVVMVKQGKYIKLPQSMCYKMIQILFPRNVTPFRKLCHILCRLELIG